MNAESAGASFNPLLLLQLPEHKVDVMLQCSLTQRCGLWLWVDGEPVQTLGEGAQVEGYHEQEYCAQT
jgi:hypothetical protein